MEAINQIGHYQLENLVMQRVNFTLIDLTLECDILEQFKHLSPYYHSFLKSQIHKATLSDFRANPLFSGLAKESPIVFVCDHGIDSKKIADNLEKENYINVFYLAGGSTSIKNN